MIILLHSSKTMMPSPSHAVLRSPQFTAQARELNSFLRTLSPAEIAKHMHVSASLAEKTHKLIAAWTDEPSQQSLALDTFRGDIYSGLRASTLSEGDRDYADSTLRILSGLYGVIRPYDGICPYRLEMGYTFSGSSFKSLYAYWGRMIADSMADEELIVNTSSVEYAKTVTEYIDPSCLITPQFLTRDPETGEPSFVVVHAKIARGAFARWLITSRSTDPSQFKSFNDIGYQYNASLSTPAQPTFVCDEFGGKGLSMRLV